MVAVLVALKPDSTLNVEIKRIGTHFSASFNLILYVTLFTCQLWSIEVLIRFTRCCL